MSHEPMLKPKPGQRIRLKDLETRYDGRAWDKTSAKAELERLQARLRVLQEMLYAQGERSLLIVLQAMDAAGKDSTIEHVFSGVNPQGVRVTPFKVPSSKELAHDFLWRVHQHAPAKGMISIFNRSHYEDVLVVRVNQLVSEATWQARYTHINNFERLLYDNGTRIIKFYLHLSKEEQKERFEERLTNPEKHWKFSLGDLPVREQWGDYREAYEDALSLCNTDYAPWYIIPADRKWYRNLAVMQIIVQTLESMNLAFPEQEDDLSKVVIPD